jgi:hypothetical protein
MPAIRFTHRGWLGICPIYLADTDSDAPFIMARHWALDWLLDAHIAVLDALFSAVSCINPWFAPRWPLLITEALPRTKCPP